MTICIPKRPFEIIGDYIQYIFLFSWIPLFGIVIYGIIIKDATFCTGISGILPFVCFIDWFKDENENKKWIKWCDKK